MNYTKTYTFLFFYSCLCLFFCVPLNAQKLSEAQRKVFQKKGAELLKKGNQLTQVNLDSSLLLKEQAVLYFEKAQDWEGQVEAINTLTYIYYFKQDFEHVSQYTQIAVETAQKHQVKETSQAYMEAINNLGALAYQKNDYALAEQMYLQSIDIEKKMGQSKSNLATLYYNLAIAKRKKGDFDEAIHYFEQALDLRLDTLGKIHPEVARNYMAIGNVFKEKKQWNTALKYYQSASNILQNPKIQKNQLSQRIQINCYQNTAEYYIQDGDIDKALNFLQKALALQPDDQSYRKSLSFEQLGKAYQKNGSLEKAIEHFKEAKRLSLIQHKTYKKHPVIAKRSQYLAAAYLEQGNEATALQEYQMALNEIAHEFSEEAVGQNPSLDDLFSKNDALDILKGKAKALHQKYLKDKNQINDLESAYYTYQLAAKVIRFLREDVASQGSKYFLADKSLSIYESAIQLAIELHHLTGAQHYLEEAFLFAESNKALSLQESMKDKLAKTFAGIPDSLLQLEKNLKVDLTFYEKELSKAKRKKGAVQESRLKQLAASHFNTREAYKKLVRDFEQNYPKYYQLKYDLSSIKVQDIQAQLHTNKLLLEYFVGEQDIYIFGISQNQIQVKAVKNAAELLSKVEQLRAFVSQPPALENSQNHQNAFHQQAYDLYQILVAPLDRTDCQELLIIPDDYLSYLPFDVLLTEAPKTLTNTKQVNSAYLIQNKAIAYHYSAALMLSKSQSHQKKSISFAGFAPTFQDGAVAEQRLCTADQLYNLNCSQEEVESISQLFKGKTYSAKAANKTVFEQNIDQYQIIHLATHACVDDVDPMSSRIYFTDDQLSNYDLYNLQLQADLAVLSACNTGSGKLVKGEGVMSLARGFIHAGCPSVLMSLWSVDDCATSEIMLQFYQQLKEGKNKDAALRQAKLNYLSSTDRLHMHPYYWSAFVQVGDTKALAFANGFAWSWLLLLGFIGSFMGLLRWKFS